MTMSRPSSSVTQGVALVSVLLLLAVLLVIITLYSSLALRETLSSNLSGESLRGFYAAEGGLNRRVADTRAIFNGYNLPSGSGPITAAPCAASDMGSGDLACQTLSAFSGRKVVTYTQNLTKDQVNGDPGVVESGSPFAGMNFLQFTYRVHSKAISTAPASMGQVQAKTEMEFQSRLVPIFQFMGFFENDLELGVGVAFTLNGRLHSNHDVYLGGDWPYGAPNPSTNIYSKFPTTITAAGDLSAARHNNPVNPYQNRAAVNNKLWGAPTASLAPMTAAEKAAVFPDAQSSVKRLDAPPLTTLAPSTSSDFWNYASLRMVAVKSGAGYAFESRRADMSNNTVNTANLASCLPFGGGAAVSPLSVTSTLFDGRENSYVTTFNVDQGNLMACMANGDFTRDDGTVLTVTDANHGGLVLHLSFDDPAALGTGQGFGVRVTNAAQLGVPGGSTYTNVASENQAFTLVTAQTVRFGTNGSYVTKAFPGGTYGCNLSTFGSDPAPGFTKFCDLVTPNATAIAPKGLTIVSDQPVYLQGDFNAINKISAAVMGDAINLLSNAWNETKSPTNGLPLASSTTINAALLSGSDVTVPGVRDGGGMHNFLRLHEDWRGTQATLTYRGSIVSLGTTLHTHGAWCIYGQCYTAPIRNFDYDTLFNSAATLPPLTPNVVYLRQLVFNRNF